MLKKHLPTFIFFLFLFGFSFWLMFHTFSYDHKTQTLFIATKVWSDFASHIPLIRSFSLGANWPPEHPLFPGEPIRYHFLFYLLVGILEKIGLPLDWALNIPSGLGFFLLLLSLYLVAIELFQSRKIAFLSILFFLFNGSLSYLRFFQNQPLGLKVISAIFRVREFPSFAPWGPGEITAFWNLNIYTNQRHLAPAFALTLLFILTCLKLQKQVVRHQKLFWAILWGALIGLIPYFHQPTLVVFASISVPYFLLFPRLRIFLIVTGLVAGIIALPQLLALTSHGPESLAWYPGYLIHDRLSFFNFLFFWWQNLGLHSLIIILGFWLIPRRAQKALLPLFFLFVAANTFRFSVEVAASHKFFNFALILGQLISAYVIVTLWAKVTTLRFYWLARVGAYAFMGLLVFALTFSGIIDFFVIVNDTKIGIADIPGNETAAWIAAHTNPKAVFLTARPLYHPASLAGRKIFYGWPYFAWSAGYNTSLRDRQVKSIFEARNVSQLCHALERLEIDYIALETGSPPQLAIEPNSNLGYNLKLLFVNRGKNFEIYEPQCASSSSR